MTEVRERKYMEELHEHMLKDKRLRYAPQLNIRGKEGDYRIYSVSYRDGEPKYRFIKRIRIKKLGF